MKFLFCILFVFSSWVAGGVAVGADVAVASSTNLKVHHQGFVNIGDVDPSIVIDLKYADRDNFLQESAPGYKTAEAMLTAEAAEALKLVQEYLVTRGYSLVIYDAYHPLKTYKVFEKWLENPCPEDVKALYYPNISKLELISDGYISSKGEHTRGSTVGVTIIELNKQIKKPCSIREVTYQDTGSINYKDDGTVDMGSSYDLFDPVASHDCDSIEPQAKEHRALLKTAMENYGFIANPKVWWQYRLAREPYPDSNFDFDV